MSARIFSTERGRRRCQSPAAHPGNLCVGVNKKFIGSQVNTCPELVGYLWGACGVLFGEVYNCFQISIFAR